MLIKGPQHVFDAAATTITFLSRIFEYNIGFHVSIFMSHSHTFFFQCTFVLICQTFSWSLMCNIYCNKRYWCINSAEKHKVRNKNKKVQKKVVSEVLMPLDKAIFF